MFERLDSQRDVLAQVLRVLDLGGALAARTELRAPWALHFGDEQERAAFHIIAGGTCLARCDQSGQTVELGAGDVVLFPHGAGHTLGDSVTTPAVEFSSIACGVPPRSRVEVPVGGDGAATTLLCGSYVYAADGPNPLLHGLPDVLHVPAAHTRASSLAATVELLVAEAESADPGSSLVIDRLVDLTFVYALRAWLDLQGDDSAPTWFGALHDPIVGPTIRAIHDDPAHPWTVAELARHSGLSRAPFARRFREAVGEAPLTYLTRWRMAVAAGLLADGARVATVALRVGYDSEFAFAKAFKRVRGIAPGQQRRQATGLRSTAPPVRQHPARARPARAAQESISSRRNDRDLLRPRDTR
jgi:AraC-like DNA-binding protein